MKKIGTAYLWPLVFGVALIIAGLVIQIPGGVLTTYSFMDGESTTAYEFDDKYCTIDEYVGGDAYNFIIGASLIAGKTSGTMAAKTICIVGGLMCVCSGMVLLSISRKESELSVESDGNPDINSDSLITLSGTTE